jgi:hypothetical protein
MEEQSIKKRPTNDRKPIIQAALVEAMADAGATYRITASRSLIIRGIVQLSGEL